jgi:hypothetical protein
MHSKTSTTLLSKLLGTGGSVKNGSLMRKIITTHELRMRVRQSQL